MNMQLSGIPPFTHPINNRYLVVEPFRNQIVYWSPTLAAAKGRATSLNKDIIKKMEREKAHHEHVQETLPEDQRTPYNSPYKLFTVMSKTDYIELNNKEKS